MNYNDLKFQEKYIGKKIISGAKEFILSDDLSEKDKKFIYNMITKQVFDIYDYSKLNVSMSAPVSNKEIEIINVKNVTTDLSNKSMKELRALYPNIKATSKADFISKINKK